MPYVDEINRAGETTDLYAKALSTARNINGMAFNGTSNITDFAVCATAADTAAKTATLTGFSLATGSQVTIKFTNGNTAANPTLEINNSGAKSIKSAGTTTLTPDTIAAGETVQLVYDGTNWMLINGNLYPELSNVKSAISAVTSEEFKAALLNLAQNVAFSNGNGETYYNDLYNALYPGVGIEYITAVYTPGSGVIFTDDDLSVLRDNLVVTAHYSDSTSAVVESYILSGTLVAGTSTISVSYGGVSTTFTVSNVVDFYNNNTWVWPTDQLLNKVNGTFVAPAAGNNNTIRINANNPYGNSMRVFAVTKGDSAVFKNHADGSDTIYYPIPVPASANKVTITVEPNTIYVRGTMVEYYASTQKYYSQSSVAWSQGSASGSLASVTGKRYFVPSIKATSDGETAFVNEPTSFTVTFSQEA